MKELGALLRDVRRQSGDPVEVVILAVAVRYYIVPVVGDGNFGEVSGISSPVYAWKPSFRQSFIRSTRSGEIIRSLRSRERTLA